MRASQGAMAIQGIIADIVGEARGGLVCRICTDVFPDGVSQGLAGAARYIKEYRHNFRNWSALGVILSGNDVCRQIQG